VVSMDLMRKILSSPLTRRRGQSSDNTSATDSSSTVVSNGSATSAADITRRSNAVEGSDVSTTVRPRYFGTALSELVSRDGTDVPRLLLKLAHCVCIRGYGSVQLCSFMNTLCE